MTELFVNIPPAIKSTVKQLVDKVLLEEPDITKATELLALYSGYISDEAISTFIDFYFKLKLEQMKNESNND